LEREAQKAELLKNIAEGQVVEGQVKNITDYGAFIDLGGIDGLLGLLAALVVVGALVVAGIAAVLILGLVWLPLALVVWTSRLLSAALSRAAEFAADRHAVELGFGPGLIRMLELLQQTELRAPRAHGPRALLRSHPTCQARLAAIRDLTAEGAGT
jgi:Zn-dependent protease with chaperone function